MGEKALDTPVIEDCGAVCPKCVLGVSYKWERGGGFISEPHNVLVADCVYHAECWDAIEAEGIPAPTAEQGEG